jgi:hypothetical protein
MRRDHLEKDGSIINQSITVILSTCMLYKINVTYTVVVVVMIVYSHICVTHKHRVD